MGVDSQEIYLHRNDYLMLCFLACSTTLVANLVNYICHPHEQEDSNNLISFTPMSNCEVVTFPFVSLVSCGA